MRNALLATLLLAVAACGGGADEQEVVLWRSASPELQLAAPPEAAWEPVYQRLRERLAEQAGATEDWVCYGGGSFDEVLAFYAPLYGLAVDDVAVERQPIADHFAAIARVSAELGQPLPVASASGELRRAVLGPDVGLPFLLLESPYPDPVTGQPRPGTLACLRASAEGS